VIYPGFRKNPANASEGPLLPAPWRGNVRGPSAAFSLKPRQARRVLDAARAASDPLLVEMDFRTGGQSHTCLEPHAAIARFDGDALTLHASTQAVFQTKSAIAKRFQLDVGKVRVIAEHIGGGFGSKGALTGEAVAAVALAREAKAPVRVAFDRREELSVAGYRPGAEVKAALLPAAGGALKSLSMTAYSDAGVAVNSTIAALARLMYPAQAMALADFDVVSNLPPGAPFRGPGGPVMAFALEQCVDEAAQRLKADPIALRKRWDLNPNRRRLYDWAAGLDAWRGAAPATGKSGRFRRGVGVAAGFWLYLWQPGSKVEVAVANRRVRVSVAVQDIGTGIRSVLADTIAREFALEPAEVEVRIGDSDLPEGPASGGSRTTASVVPTAILAAQRLKEALQRNASADPKAGSNAPWRDLIAASPDLAASAERPVDSGEMAPGVRSPIAEVGLMGHVFGWIMRRFNHLQVGAGVPSCVQVAEVEVDTWLGQVRVLRVHTGIAVGRIAAPALAHSQAAGSIIQGVGYALYEGREIDPRTGEVMTAGLEDYRIPGIADTPLIDVHFDEGGFDHVPGGSVGIGEVATIPTSAAIANAICNATGVRLTEIPVRPDRLIAALKQRSAA
jgi:xanthine dehydrogenase YagR molybdenum-binding subunit